MFVITGAGGFLGSYLIKCILDNTDEKIIACARNKSVFSAENERVSVLCGDLTDKNYLSHVAEKINENENVKIIWTAACHNIDYVAKNPDEAYYFNVTIPSMLLEKVKTFEKLMFTSSDTVYGEGGAYAFREDDELKPISVYGSQKAEAEKVFVSKGGTALRLPLMFSRSLSVTKKHFCDIIYENLKNGEVTKLVTGAVRSTLDYSSVAEIIIGLCRKNELPSVINISGDDALSKFELGILFAECNGLDKSLLEPVASLGETAEGAKRADSTVLSNALLKKILEKDEIKIKL
ncbi:MAG: sugar nucleotide-binding protein [Clostridia bacterium]|nr:sugar nucleotide-binding protein [Clostridia bacterium]